MAGLNDITIEAGLNPSKCGGCQKCNDCTKQVQELFKAILRRVARGEMVRISGFGTFRARKFKGRTLNTPILEGGKIAFPDSLVLRFHQSVVAKKVLNELAKELEKGAKKTNGKKAKKADEENE